MATPSESMLAEVMEFVTEENVSPFDAQFVARGLNISNSSANMTLKVLADEQSLLVDRSERPYRYSLVNSTENHQESFEELMEEFTELAQRIYACGRTDEALKIREQVLKNLGKKA